VVRRDGAIPLGCEIAASAETVIVRSVPVKVNATHVFGFFPSPECGEGVSFVICVDVPLLAHCFLFYMCSKKNMF
jgi:hypothetical protein